jgi:hypothetical protein
MEKTIFQSDYGFRTKDRGTEKSFKPALIGARSFLKSISDDKIKSSERRRIPKAKRLNVTDMI